MRTNQRLQELISDVGLRPNAEPPVSQTRVTRTVAVKRNHLLTSIAVFFLGMFVCMIPLENALVLPGFGTLGRMVGLAAFPIGVLAVLDRGKMRSLTLPHLFMVAFVGWLGLTYFWSDAPELTLIQIQTYLQLLGMVWLIWEVAAEPRQQIRVMQAYLLGSAILAGGVIFASGPAALRSTAFNFDPNDIGLRLALSVPISLYLAASEKKGLQLWLYRAHTVMAVCGLFLTASRGAFVTLCVALLMIPLSIRWWSARQRISMGLVAAVAVVVAITIVPKFAWERLASSGNEISEGTMNKRTVIWEAGAEVFENHPFTGVGAGAFTVSMQRELAYPWAAHNTFLSVLVEQGVIGFAIFFSLLLTMGFGVMRMPPLERNLWMVMLLCWAAACSSLTWEYSKPTWLVFGLLAAHLATLVPEKTSQKRPIRPPQPMQPERTVQLPERLRVFQEMNPDHRQANSGQVQQTARRAWKSLKVSE